MRQAELDLSEKYIKQNCDGISAIDHPDMITRKRAPGGEIRRLDELLEEKCN